MSSTDGDARPTIDAHKVFEEGTEIDRAVRNGARSARRRHKLLGIPLVVWEDGRVVHVPPEEIVVGDEE